jgi:hypothetical protein
MVPGERWTPALIQEAERRWAVAVIGRADPRVPYVRGSHAIDGGIADVSLEAILHRRSARRLTNDEFSDAFGDLPSDAES